jgi:hypothetical protein
MGHGKWELPSMVSNVFVEQFEEIALYTADQKPDTSMTHSWFGHMDQQDCRAVFTVRTLGYHQIYSGS